MRMLAHAMAVAIDRGMDTLRSDADALFADGRCG